MKRILIVDDFEAGRRILREKLEMQGYACQEVENGLEAMETLQDKSFDLIITDNRMPVMTGLELIQTLAKKPTEHQTPIILLTGHPTSQLFCEAKNSGVQAVFAKPYNEQDLALEITRILES
jgi:CheY-like chemotaxis protein